MRADWTETSLTEDGTWAAIMMELQGTPAEIEEIRRMTKATKRWSATVTGAKRDRIVLKQEETGRWPTAQCTSMSST